MVCLEFVGAAADGAVGEPEDGSDLAGAVACSDEGVDALMDWFEAGAGTKWDRSVPRGFARQAEQANEARVGGDRSWSAALREVRGRGVVDDHQERRQLPVGESDLRAVFELVERDRVELGESGRLATVTEPGGATTTYEYDGND